MSCVGSGLCEELITPSGVCVCNRVRACVRAFVCVRARARVYVCVRARARARVCVCNRVRFRNLNYETADARVALLRHG